VLSRDRQSKDVRVELYLGEAPLFERKISAGLLDFGLCHPGWRFSVRGASFRYTPSWLRANGIQGVLVVVDAATVGDVLDKARIPWVHVFPGQAVDHPAVNVDDRAIGRMGAEHLLEKGFHRFSFCGFNTPWCRDRARSFVDRLAESNRSADVVMIPFTQRQDWLFSTAVHTRLRKWVEALDKQTAIMAAHDALANGLVDACLQEGLRVPQDVAILGSGNHDLFCRLSPVPISSVETAVPRAAFKAAEILDAMLQGKRPPANTLIAPSGVFERQSTDIRVYENELIDRILLYIREHAGDALRVDDLVRNFGISHRSLSRYFANVIGHSPGVEIRKARQRMALELLETSTLSMTEVAVACGYSDLPHMDRSFKTSLGMPPSALRSQRELQATLGNAGS
jgi:LacI family transcriptional regulator